MTATNHILSGSLIGALMPLPLAIPLAFCSHFILDALPHYGILKRKRNDSLTYKLIVFGDVFIALFLVVSLALLHKWRMEFVGLLAYSPDTLWGIYYFKHGRNLNFKPRSKFLRFHTRIQRFERPWGIAVELVALIAMFPVFAKQLF